MVAAVAHHGDFNEYNSPTYTMVALEESERALYLVSDEETRQAAEAIRRQAWKVIAEHFHPATEQWVGPHSRTYSDFVLPEVAARLARSTGRPIRCWQRREAERSILDIVPNLIPERPCPEAYLGHFDPQSQPRIVSGVFSRNASSEVERRGETWLHPEAALGTINADSMWTQRRGVIGYWPDGKGQPAVFRFRALKDGRDFASFFVRTSQRENQAIVAAAPSRGFGDYHIGMDRTADGGFDLQRLVIRFSLNGVGASIEEVDGAYRLSCGDWLALVKPLEAVLWGRPLAWETSVIEEGDEQTACLDAILIDAPDEPPQRFFPDERDDTRVAAYIRIQPRSEPSVPPSAEVSPQAEQVDPAAGQASVLYRCGDLSLAVPRQPF
jgi:hypothetical protein